MDVVMTWQAYVSDTLRHGVSHLPVGRKAASMFNSCMMQTGSQVDVIKEFMMKHGLAWPEDPVGGSNPLEVLFDLAFNWNVNLWFSLKLLSSTVDDHQKRRLFLAPYDHLQFWRAISWQLNKTRYETVYSNFLKIFANNTNELSPVRVAEDYDTFKNVFEVLIASRTGKGRVPAMFPLSHLNNHIEAPTAKDLKPAIEKALRIEPPFTMDDLLLVSDMDLLKRVLKICGDVKDRVVRRQLSWLFLQAYASVANPAAVLRILHGSEHRAQEERLRFCSGQVEASYKLLVSAMAAVAHFSEEERKHVDSLLAAVQKTAVRKASAVSWLDKITRQIAAEKLSSVRTVLWPAKKFLTAQGLEEAYANFTDHASSFASFWIETRRSQRALVGTEAGLQELLIGDSIAQPYAQYEHVMNRLSLSLGALVPPLYYKSGTKAMQYGGLGYFYAKELVGAVDIEGVKVRLMHP
ncbi:hypothetical protein V5799_012081 [Amblyomma americanum]|uniref:Peptidase M13 N-terminal domain-containing protein n=1 Tax=Amblyomma americanum TaxID=6943 RepID=A0AAQ4EF04_AMBAM